ncbi:MAG: D-aminoacylase [Clostridia bacterium]|nr:D-aminoacylase [Clostridia bacterium]
MYELMIKNARIYDGSGTPSFVGTVAVEGGTIAYVGKDDEALTARRVVDADGLCLSPGFIDSHSHSDQSILEDPTRLHVLRMGVTTEVAGQCGFSRSPYGKDMKEGVHATLLPLERPVFESMGDFVRTLDGMKLGTNQLYFTGHGVLRGNVMDCDARLPERKELARMQDLLVREIEDGSAGYSTGLSYVPGIYSNSEELIALAKTASEKGGMYVTHSRSESMGLFDSVAECIRIAREAEIAVNISHFKCVGRVFWERCTKALSMIDEAIAEGLRVTLDAYPYTAASTTTLSAIPAAFQDQGIEAFAKSLDDPNVVEAIRREIFEVNDPSWDNSIYYVGLENFLVVRANETPWMIGKTYADIGKELGVSPYEGMIWMLRKNHGNVWECRFSMCEENVEQILVHSTCAVGSDGIFVVGDKSAHPRAFGTFPRYLGHYIRDRKILSREEGIRRITSMPAERYGLTSKGRITKGYDADFVLFDFDTIRDGGTYIDPFLPNEGIKSVWMMGEKVLEDNEPTGNYCGRYQKRRRV